MDKIVYRVDIFIFDIFVINFLYLILKWFISKVSY